MTLQDIIHYTKQLVYVVSVYECTKAGYCAIASFFVFGIIYLLRKTVLRNKLFARGLVWIFLLPVLYMGRLKLYYTNRFFAKVFLWWYFLCGKQTWICLIYLAGVAVTAIVLLYQRYQVGRLFRSMECEVILEQKIYVTELAISPFSTGLFKRRIVIPRTLLEQCGKKELSLILLHEQMHIRLGHLWFYALWDFMECILWINPFFHLGRKDFRADMEQICDIVSIQKSRENAKSYGKLILKSMELLQERQQILSGSAAFAAEPEYGRIKSRIRNIAAFKGYSRWRVQMLSVIGLAAVFLLVCGIYQVSYARYTPMEDVSVYSTAIAQDGSQGRYLLEDSERLRQAVSYDSENVYIDRMQFDSLLQENGVEEREFYIFFGGYLKLPGMGGGGDCIYVEYESGEEDMTIPYDSHMDIWTMLFQYL